MVHSEKKRLSEAPVPSAQIEDNFGASCGQAVVVFSVFSFYAHNPLMAYALGRPLGMLAA